MELQNTVLSGSLLIAAVVAVVAGLISFFSPCSLPLLPGYLSYVAGVSGQESAVARELGGGAVAGRRRTLSGAGLFVLGFAAVFTSYGALFGALGSQLVRHQDLIIRASGALTVLLGLVFATSGSLVPVLGRTIRIDYQPRIGLGGAPVLGVVFGIGWTPCIGPTLAASPCAGNQFSNCRSRCRVGLRLQPRPWRSLPARGPLGDQDDATAGLGTPQPPHRESGWWRPVGGPRCSPALWCLVSDDVGSAEPHQHLASADLGSRQ